MKNDNCNNNNNNNNNEYERTRIKLISTNNSSESNATGTCVGYVNKSDVIKAKLTFSQESGGATGDTIPNDENDTFSDFAAAATVISKSNIIDNNEWIEMTDHDNNNINNDQDSKIAIGKFKFDSNNHSFNNLDEAYAIKVQIGSLGELCIEIPPSSRSHSISNKTTNMIDNDHDRDCDITGTGTRTGTNTGTNTGANTNTTTTVNNISTLVQPGTTNKTQTQTQTKTSPCNENDNNNNNDDNMEALKDSIEAGALTVALGAATANTSSIFSNNSEIPTLILMSSGETTTHGHEIDRIHIRRHDKDNNNNNNNNNSSTNDSKDNDIDNNIDNDNITENLMNMSINDEISELREESDLTVVAITNGEGFDDIDDSNVNIDSSIRRNGSAIAPPTTVYSTLSTHTRLNLGVTTTTCTDNDIDCSV